MLDSEKGLHASVSGASVTVKWSFPVTTRVATFGISSVGILSWWLRLEFWDDVEGQRRYENYNKISVNQKKENSHLSILSILQYSVDISTCIPQSIWCCGRHLGDLIINTQLNEQNFQWQEYYYTVEKKWSVPYGPYGRTVVRAQSTKQSSYSVISYSRTATTPTKEGKRKLVWTVWSA